MKKDFFDIVYKKMKNTDIYMLFCGLGYPRYTEFRGAYPNRVINCEASEQTALDIACGLAVSGKIPFVYSITPFLLWRGAETIRTYINHEKLHVILVGAGRDSEYAKDDGFSHDATDDYLFIENMPSIQGHWPEDVKELKSTVRYAIQHKSPHYINIRR